MRAICLLPRWRIRTEHPCFRFGLLLLGAVLAAVLGYPRASSQSCSSSDLTNLHEPQAAQLYEPRPGRVLVPTVSWIDAGNHHWRRDALVRLCYSIDGTRLAGSTSAGRITVWNMANKTVERELLIATVGDRVLTVSDPKDEAIRAEIRLNEGSMKEAPSIGALAFGPTV